MEWETHRIWLHQATPWKQTSLLLKLFRKRKTSWTTKIERQNEQKALDIFSRDMVPHWKEPYLDLLTAKKCRIIAENKISFKK